MDKYKVYCETDNKWEYVISAGAPAACPTDAAHSIKTDSISIEEKSVEYNDGTTKNLSLQEHKQLRFNEIDKRTRELISQGFVFDSVLFSASETAQRNWLALDSFRSELTYPFNVSTKDSSQYSIIDAATMHNLALSGLATIDYHYGNGSNLKAQIYSASSISEIDGIIDNR